MKKREDVPDSPKLKPKLVGISTPINIATGFGVSSARDLIIISFVFTPPEDRKMVIILSRTGLLPEVAESLAKTLKEMAEGIREDKKKKEPKK